MIAKLPQGKVSGPGGVWGVRTARLAKVSIQNAFLLHFELRVASSSV